MKKTLFLTLLCAALLAPSVAAQEDEGKAAEPSAAAEKSKSAAKVPKTLRGGWVLKWNDEFDGNRLDETKWAYELGVVRNKGSKQAYTKDCVEVKDGMLLLHSRAQQTENVNFEEGSQKWWKQIRTQPYASGSVTTRGVMHFTPPARLEFRARIPKAKGVWPAIWTLHVNDYEWPTKGEIDILEHISQEPNKVHSIFRWGKNGTSEEYKPVSKVTTIPNFSDDFHLYALEWDAKMMRILIDNKEVGRVAIKDAQYPNGDNPLLTPCYIIMNTAIGGWAEAPVAAQYPVTFEIDYVRYYTKRGAKVPSGIKSKPAVGKGKEKKS